MGPVTQCNDGLGHCTLRAAIEAANGHAGVDGISFNIPTAGNNCDASGNCTINLSTALPDLSDGVNIQGPGADKLTVKRSTVSGTPQFRIFNVTTTGTVSFSGLTIANGSPAGNGGGIQNVNAGTVNVTDSTLLGNAALSSSNNSNFAGGGISNNGTGTLLPVMAIFALVFGPRRMWTFLVVVGLVELCAALSVLRRRKSSSAGWLALAMGVLALISGLCFTFTL